MVGAALGGSGALLAAGGCIASARGWRTRPLLLLALPCAALVASGVGLYVQVDELLAQFEEQWSAYGHDTRVGLIGSAGRALLYDAGLGALWAAVGFAGAIGAAAAVRSSPGAPARRDFDPVIWAAGPLAAGTLATVYLLGHAHLVQRLRTDGVDAALRTVGESVTGLANVFGAWLLLPQLPWLLTLVGLPLVLSPLFGVMTRSDLDRGRRAGLSVAAILGIGAAGALSMLSVGGGRFLHQLVYLGGGLLQLQTTYFRYPMIDGFRTARAAQPEAAAWLLLLGVLAIPVLLAGWIEVRRALLPVGLVALAGLAAFGGRGGAAFRVAHVFGPVCQEACTELQRVTTVVRGGRPQWLRQMAVDRCPRDVRVDPGLHLPVVETDTCADVGLHLRIGPDDVTVDGVLMGGIEVLAEDGDLAELRRKVLEEKAEDARAVASRNPSYPFQGEYLLAVDTSHDWAVVDAARHAAGEAGFCDPHLVVVLPGHADPPWIRMVPTGLRRGSSTPQTTTWGLAIREGGHALLAPDGTVTGLPVELPVLDALAGQTVPTSAGTTLVLCPDDDLRIAPVLRLAVELDARFDRVILDSACDDVQIAGSPDPFCTRFDSPP